jgi:hypothetical protein
MRVSLSGSDDPHKLARLTKLAPVVSALSLGVAALAAVSTRATVHRNLGCHPR